jgi:hypothetical protein
MTDGTIATIVGVLVGLLATFAAAVVVSGARGRERRRAADHEVVALRDARLRAEHGLLEVRLGELREEVANLQRRHADLVASVEAEASRRDPAAAVAAGALRRAHAHTHEELARRLRRAGDARVIPFPFLHDPHSSTGQDPAPD